ncbi:MAG: DUF421 domain-containing protein [Bacillota bacterium]
MNQYLVILIRVFITWPLLFITTMLMGKRNMGQLPVFDFIIVITVGSIAATNLADPAVPHGPTLMSIGVIALIQIIFSKLQLKSAPVRNFTNITPTIIIQDGQFLTHNLAKIRYTIDDILPLLRIQGVFNLSEVDYAIIEPNGNLSVLKKANASPVTPADLKMNLPNKGLPQLLVADGLLVPNAFKGTDVDQEWLEQEIRRHGFAKISEIYLASLEKSGYLYISPMRGKDPGRSLHY